jgi:Tol biopolymer transport system component
MDFQLNSEFFKPLNTNGFDAMSHVNLTGTHAYLTINTSEAEKTTKSSDLFEIVSEEPFRWESATLIKGKKVNTDYFEGGATVTDSCADGNFMVFISDRQATETGLDLYYFPIKDDQSGIATRLPKEINTEGNETTPFLTSKGDLLFFSSDALAGYGGYDIYYCRLENGVWSPPTNLGPNINSVNDDTHFRYDPTLKVATWASMADKDGFFSYDLFQADLSSQHLGFLK